MWNNELELKFIEHFQAEPILSDSKHRHYKDKSLNHDAWSRIGELMVPELKKKKGSLFASYRKKRKMLTDSSRSGAGENEVYKPICFAYDVLDSFLSEGLTPRATINTTLSTEQLCTPTVDNKEETINENRLIAENKNGTKSPQTARPRSLQREMQEAGKQVKEAASLLQQRIKKRDSQAFQDDCDIYALGLAKKLRAFSEEERLEIMYDIDGMILNRRRAKHSNRFTSTTFIAPSQYSRCSSPMSSCSEPLSREVPYSQNTRMEYSEPAQIHVPQEQRTRQIYSTASEISQSITETGSNIRIISNQAVGADHLSDIIAQAYNTA